MKWLRWLVVGLALTQPALAQNRGTPIGPIGGGTSGGGGGSGTVTSISAGCGATAGGGAITTSGTIAAVNNPLHPTSGNFVAATVCGNTAYYDSASDQSPTLPTAASAGAGGFFTTCSVNHAQTITRSGSDTIGITGAATTYSLGSGTVTAPTCVGFQSDGTSIWTPTPYGSSGASGITIGTTTITSGTSTRILYDNAGVVGEYTLTGSGTVVAMATSPSFTTPTLGVAASTSVSSTASNVNTQSINATSTDGLVLTNTTAAANAAQQWSPRLHFTGQGWKTNSTAASQSTDWIVENQPQQGSGNPATNLVFSSSINGGGYTSRMVVTSSSAVIVGGATGTAGGWVNVANGAGIISDGALLLGISNSGGGGMTIATGGPLISAPVGGVIGWTAGASSNAALDTGLSRISAGVVGVGTGAAASVAGTISVAGAIVGGTAGASCTLTVVAHLTVVNGIVTLCN